MNSYKFYVICQLSFIIGSLEEIITQKSIDVFYKQILIFDIYVYVYKQYRTKPNNFKSKTAQDCNSGSYTYQLCSLE
jgi:hypothetical protein